MTTDRERVLIASCQDRMLREADATFFDDGRSCGTCGDFDTLPYRDSEGDVWDGRMGVCHDLDYVCEADAPACEWWHE